MQRSIVIALLAALLLTIFALQNDEQVAIDFFFGKPVEGSLSLILLITVIIGVILGVIFSIPSINKQARMIQNKNKEIDKLQSQVEAYRKQFGSQQGQKQQEEESQPSHKKEKRR
jgi:uncharacterized integral membrane protein